MKKIFKILGIVVAIIVLAFGGMAIWFGGAVTADETKALFITTNPLDLSQIESFSKYRSCMGHDYRGPGLSGETEATPRSMKHYIRAKPQYRGTIDKVSAFAPFDGVVSVIDDDLGGPGDQQIWLTSESKSPRQWQFIFFHMNLKPGLEKGSKVKAGELIGNAALRREGNQITDNFDIAVKFTRPMHRPAIDAPFRHMAKSVLDEYKKYGVTDPSNLEISEQERDAALCVIDPNVNYGGPDAYFKRETAPSDHIVLKKL